MSGRFVILRINTRISHKIHWHTVPYAYIPSGAEEREGWSILGAFSEHSVLEHEVWQSRNSYYEESGMEEMKHERGMSEKNSYNIHHNSTEVWSAHHSTRTKWNERRMQQKSTTSHWYLFLLCVRFELHLNYCSAVFLRSPHSMYVQYLHAYLYTYGVCMNAKSAQHPWYGPSFFPLGYANVEVFPIPMPIPCPFYRL